MSNNLSIAHLVLEHLGVAHDGLMIAGHTIVIDEHLLLVVQLSIGAEVVGKVGRLGLLIAVVAWDLPGLGLVRKCLVAHFVRGFGSGCAGWNRRRRRGCADTSTSGGGDDECRRGGSKGRR